MTEPYVPGWNHAPRPGYAVSFAAIGDASAPAVAFATLDDAVQFFLEHHAPPLNPGIAAWILDSTGAAVVAWTWPFGAAHPAWYGCQAGFDAMQPHAPDQLLLVEWELQASGHFDNLAS